MIEPVDGLLLVIAQSPEAAHVVAPALLHDVLTSAQIPAVAARCEREADDVASVQPARFPVIAIDPSQERARSGWTYSKEPRPRCRHIR